MNLQEGPCVGCSEFTTDTTACNCAQAVFACAACGDSAAPLRCGACREREPWAAYPCLDFRGDPEAGGDMGGFLPAAAPVGARGSP